MESHSGSEQCPSLAMYRHVIRSHYAPVAEKRDIVKKAYESACTFVQTELHGSSLADILGLEHRMDDVREIVEQTKTRYETCSQGRQGVFKHLTRFSARFMYFAQVLDVLSQYHPEYVSLAWGTLKFIFMGIINHSRLISEFSKALASISDALRQTKLTAELFQTDLVRDAISQLYAHIMLFFQQAIRWYNRSSAGRAFNAIFKPYELEYEDTVEQIRLCAEAINDIASAASRVEVRDINITTQLIIGDMEKRDQKLAEMQRQLKEAHELQLEMAKMVNSSLQVASSHKAISERIFVDVQDMAPRIRDTQFSEILQALKPSTYPQQLFNKLHAITKRSQSLKLPLAESNEIIRSLNVWFSREGSALFILRVGPRAEAKAIEITTEIISFLREKQMNVVWRLSPLSKDDNGDVPSITEMIKVLVFQAIQLNPSILLAHSDDCSVIKISSTHTEAGWLSFFDKIFTRLGKCYIIIETRDLFQASRRKTEWIANFLSIFSTFVDHARSNGSSLKFLVLHYGGANDIALRIRQDRDYCIVSTLRRPLPIPIRLKHTVSHKKGAKGWQRLQPKY